MMRVAYVSLDAGVPIFGRKGCSIHVQEVMRALVERGAQVHLFSARCEGQPSPGLEAVRIHELPRPGKGDLATRERHYLAQNGDLQSALERQGPFELVYERYSLWSFAGMEYARQMGVPALLEVNAPLVEEEAQHRDLVDRAGAERVAGRVFGAATALLAVSEEVATYLHRFPGAHGKVHVVPNGVNPARFPGPTKPARARTPDTFTVGFVGTLKPWHGLLILVEAFAQLHQRQPNARLLIVGDGPERESIEAAVSARGLQEAVHYAGAVAPGEVAGWLASMDVGVAPYPRLEQFYFSPLKVYEYMAAGLPVVASRLGQLEQLIRHGLTGWLTTAGDAAELAQALEHLARSPELRQRLGQAARADVLQEHTWAAVAERILRLAGLEESGQSESVKHASRRGITF
jgi:glycosyltransferase involved in cell wall biosynthesis